MDQENEQLNEPDQEGCEPKFVAEFGQWSLCWLDGQFYWSNDDTNETSWDKPEEVSGSLALQAIRQSDLSYDESILLDYAESKKRSVVTSEEIEEKRARLEQIMEQTDSLMDNHFIPALEDAELSPDEMISCIKSSTDKFEGFATMVGVVGNWLNMMDEDEGTCDSMISSIIADVIDDVYDPNDDLTTRVLEVPDGQDICAQLVGLPFWQEKFNQLALKHVGHKSTSNKVDFFASVLLPLMCELGAGDKITAYKSASTDFKVFYQVLSNLILNIQTHKDRLHELLQPIYDLCANSPQTFAFSQRAFRELQKRASAEVENMKGEAAIHMKTLASTYRRCEEALRAHGIESRQNAVACLHPLLSNKAEVQRAHADSIMRLVCTPNLDKPVTADAMSAMKSLIESFTFQILEKPAALAATRTSTLLLILLRQLFTPRIESICNTAYRSHACRLLVLILCRPIILKAEECKDKPEDFPRDLWQIYELQKDSCAKLQKDQFAFTGASMDVVLEKTLFEVSEMFSDAGLLTSFDLSRAKTKNLLIYINLPCVARFTLHWLQEAVDGRFIMNLDPLLQLAVTISEKHPMLSKVALEFVESNITDKVEHKSTVQSILKALCRLMATGCVSGVMSLMKRRVGDGILDVSDLRYFLNELQKFAKPPFNNLFAVQVAILLREGMKRSAFKLKVPEMKNIYKFVASLKGSFGLTLPDTQVTREMGTTCGEAELIVDNFLDVVDSY
eukprot:TRINITY_DN406_c0_g1_i7.p1 TRINITY_DN406_c0_g1~~TRINITY_DN406_c0_g1_i7.p1  ORF type:complete len:733 (-),score=165.76 TRINITY_DN406_c0_g1_i7:1258-3456(-)